MAKYLTPHRLGLVAVSGCILGSLALYENSALMEHQRMFTPIVIIDRSHFLRTLPAEEDSDQRRRRVEGFEGTLLNLKDSGYLVLDASAILAAPADLLAKVPIE